MTTITNVTMKNFLSVGAVTQAVRLDINGLTLVLGQNSDATGGTTRNGAGKSTLLQAISFGIYGQPLTRIKVDNLINNVNGKAMMVTVDFERGGVKYRVERGRKPNILKFFVNGKERVDLAQGENRHTQEEIDRVFGMGHTMFKHIVALNTFTEPFLKMKAADQRDVIEELLGITQISARAETLAKVIKETRDSLKGEEATIKATTEANARIQRTIEQTEGQRDAWEGNHVERLADILAQIDAMEAIDFDAEIAAFDALDAWRDEERGLQAGIDLASREIALATRELRGLDGAIAQATRDLTGDNSAHVGRLAAERQRKTDEVAAKRVAVTGYAAELAAIEASIADPGEQTCVCCGQTLTGTDHLAEVVAKLEKQAQALRTKIAREEKAIVSLDGDIVAIDLDVEGSILQGATKRAEATERLEAARTAAEPLRDALERHTADLEAHQGLLAALAPRKPVTLFQSRDDLYVTKQAHDGLARDLETEHAKENPYTDHLASLAATIQVIDYTALADLQSLYRHQDFLLKLLTSKDSFIRKKIIDQNLSYLNNRLNTYLERLGLPHEVVFKSDMSVEIDLLGRDYDFEQLSRGEMNRVIMAVSWGFRDVWESLNESMNLLFLDEMIDSGLDGQGAEAALSVLKSMARDRKKNIFLISHRDELVGRIERTLMVSKENGFTRFEIDVVV